MEISELQKTVDQWITGTGGGYFSPLTNTAVLAEETGEVARIMARRYGDQVAKPGDKSDLADELADVIWVVTAIANQTGIDLTDALNKNIDKKNRRDSHRFTTQQ
ncbi:MAG: nucleotide pyrophosphohydrolase [Muribaculaceae bacterium]|nr:nucleotide pyrophosphohydrolase [Muribaculaceae bacterium]